MSSESKNKCIEAKKELFLLMHNIASTGKECCVCIRMHMCVYSLPQSLGRRPDASFPLFLLDRRACNICMHSRSLEAFAPRIACRQHYGHEFKCLFSFQPSTVTENVQTISRIDFLKSCYCCFAFSPTVTFHHFRYPHPVLNYHFFICICI